MEIKLGDFGLATKLEYDGEKKKTICGTPNYIAPEILEAKGGHSYEVDIWSLGVVIYTMLIGKPPFETNDVKTTYRKIRMNSYTFPENVQISIEAKGLITRILHLNPSLRPTLDEILNHEFFHTGNPIPKYLPTSTLACAPSKTMLNQFQTDKPYTVREFEDTNTNTNNLNNANLEINNKLNAVTERNDKIENKIESKTTTNFIKPQTTRNNDNIEDDDKQKERQLRTLAVSVYDPLKIEGNGGDAKDKAPDVWVRKWVDYSSKYGLG